MQLMCAKVYTVFCINYFILYISCMTSPASYYCIVQLAG